MSISATYTAVILPAEIVMNITESVVLLIETSVPAFKNNSDLVPRVFFKFG